MAIKWHDDDYYKNEYYAKVGGITLKDINSLEIDFLNLLGFKLYINQTIYQTYMERLLQYSAS